MKVIKCATYILERTVHLENPYIMGMFVSAHYNDLFGFEVILLC